MKIYFNTHVSLEDISEVYSGYDAISAPTAQVKKVIIRNMKHIRENMDILTTYEIALLNLCLGALNMSSTGNVNVAKICYSILSAIHAKLVLRKGTNKFYNKYVNFIRNIKYLITWNENKDIRAVDKLLYNRLKSNKFNVYFVLCDFDKALDEVISKQYKAAYSSILFY